MSETRNHRFRDPRSTPESRGGSAARTTRRAPAGHAHRARRRGRRPPSGRTVRADVYRPDTDEPAAVLIAWSPYGKHNPAPIGVIYPASGVLPEHVGELTTFEAPDPEYWVPHGYAIVVADVPGTWYSTGPATYCSPGGGAGLRRRHRMGRHAAVEQRKGRPVGRLVPDGRAVAGRRTEPSAPRRDQPVGGVERHLPRGRPARRHPRDLVLAVHLGAMGREPRADRRPRAGDRRASVLRRVLGVEGVAAREDHRAGLGRGQLVGSGPAHARHARGIPPDGVGAEVARHPRPQEVGGVLPARERRAAAAVLRSLPEGRRQRLGGSAARARRGARAIRRGDHDRGERVAPRRSRVHPALPRRRRPARGLAHRRAEGVAEYDGRGSGLREHRALFAHTFGERTRIVGHASAELTSRPPRPTTWTSSSRLFKRDREGRVVGFAALRAVRGRTGGPRLAAGVAPGARRRERRSRSSRCSRTSANCRWMPMARPA